MIAGRRGPRRAPPLVDTIDMTISPDLRAAMYETKVLRLAQDQTRREGEQAVELIERAAPDPDGKGATVDTYA